MTLDTPHRRARTPPPSKLGVAIGILLGAALCASPPGATFLSGQDDLVRRAVPDVMGLSLPQARAIILRARVGPVETVDTVVAGVDSATVVRQSPEGGARVTVPSTVTLWVSRPPPSGVSRIRGFLMDVAPTGQPTDPLTGQTAAPDTMPDLRGRPLREGMKLLQVMGLEAVAEAVAASDPPGTIVRHLPPPGAVTEPGGLVRLWVSGQDAERTVPRVVELPLDRARELFAEEGIQVARVDTVTMDPARLSRPPAEGTVVRQLPAAGSPLDPGALGTLWVVAYDGSAQEDPAVSLPDVVGRPLEEAIDELEGVGARVGQVVSVESRAPARSVVEQKPAGGESVPAGTAVALAVSLGPRVTVPEVVGTPVEDAVAELEAGGLTLAGVSRVPSTEAEGQVLAQSPEAGRAVAAGSGVDLTVSSAVPQPETTPVPEVVGQTMEEAEVTLRESGLQVGSLELVAADAPRGTVVGQWPPGGAALPPGGAVRLDVATGIREAPPSVPVPDVVGMTSERALQALADAGLRSVETRGEGVEVLDQFPSAGALVTPGTPVLLTLQAQVDLWSWIRRWELWGLPVGIAVLWGLLRIRRLGGKGATGREGDEGPGQEDRGDGPDPSGRVEYRLMRPSPRGSVEVEGPLLPTLALSLRARPVRSLRATVELPADGRLSPNLDPDRSPPT